MCIRDSFEGESSVDHIFHNENVLSRNFDRVQVVRALELTCRLCVLVGRDTGEVRNYSRLRTLCYSDKLVKLDAEILIETISTIHHHDHMQLFLAFIVSKNTFSETSPAILQEAIRNDDLVEVGEVTLRNRKVVQVEQECILSLIHI